MNQAIRFLSEKKGSSAGLFLSLFLLFFFCYQGLRLREDHRLFFAQLDLVNSIVISTSNLPFDLEQLEIQKSELSASLQQIDSLLMQKNALKYDAEANTMFASLKVVGSAVKLLLNEKASSFTSSNDIVGLAQRRILNEQRQLHSSYLAWMKVKREKIMVLESQIDTISYWVIPFLAITCLVFLIATILGFKARITKKDEALLKAIDDAKQKQELASIEAKKFKILRSEKIQIEEHLERVENKLLEKDNSKHLSKEEKRAIELSIYYSFQPVFEVIKQQLNKLSRNDALNREDSMKGLLSLRQRINELERELKAMEEQKTEEETASRVFLAPVLSAGAAKFGLEKVKLEGAFPQVLVVKDPFLRLMDYFFIFSKKCIQNWKTPLIIRAEDRVIDFSISFEFDPDNMDQDAAIFLNELNTSIFSSEIDGVEMLLARSLNEQEVSFEYANSKAIFTFKSQ